MIPMQSLFCFSRMVLLRLRAVECTGATSFVSDWVEERVSVRDLQRLPDSDRFRRHPEVAA